MVIKEFIVSNPAIRGGIPCLAGTRFSVAQLLAELAVGHSIHDIADNFDLDIEVIVGVLETLAWQYDTRSTSTIADKWASNPPAPPGPSPKANPAPPLPKRGPSPYDASIKRSK